MRLKIISAAIVFLSCLFLTGCETADTYTGPVLGDICDGYEDFEYLEETRLETDSESITLFVPKGRIIRLEKDSIAALCDGINMRIGTMRRWPINEGQRNISRTYCQKLLDNTTVYIEIDVLEEECSEHSEEIIRELECFYQLSILCDKRAIHNNIRRNRQTISWEIKKESCQAGFSVRERLALAQYFSPQDDTRPKGCLIFVLTPDRSGVRDLSDCYFYWKDQCREKFFHLYDATNLHGHYLSIGRFLSLILQKSFPYIKLTDKLTGASSDTLFLIIQAEHGTPPEFSIARGYPQWTKGRMCPCPLRVPYHSLTPTGSNRYTIYSICPAVPAALHDRLSR